MSRTHSGLSNFQQRYAFSAGTFTVGLFDVSKLGFKNCHLILAVYRDGQLLEDHNNFFNEARLSAIGLVIYLAGLLITVPPISSFPKVLVLDDVLIGLDMRNRMPVMDLLAEYFSGWQVIILTHDLTWYEMVRLQLAETAPWTAYEMFLNEIQRPIHSPQGNHGGYAFFLSRARRHLADGDQRAAGNYARSAFEWKLKKYCEKYHIKIPYSSDPAKVTAQHLWTAAKDHRLNAAKPAEHPTLTAHIRTVEAVRSIVLNPLSHSSAPHLDSLEIQKAITLIEGLLLLP